ncbi:MAG: hypothetical protein ACI4MK_02345 [Aristaeellaceae bacterium]
MADGRSIRVTVQTPGTEAARLHLARRTAAVHAGIVRAQLESMDCPPWQKDALLRRLAQAPENSRKTSGHG